MIGLQGRIPNTSTGNWFQCWMVRRQQGQTYQEIHTAPQETTSYHQEWKETVINLSDEKLDDAVSSLLHKGFNFAVTPRSTPIEDILTGVEKAILSLPVEKAEEARQGTVRI